MTFLCLHAVFWSLCMRAPTWPHPQVDSVLAFWSYNETAIRNDPNILATLNRRDVAFDYLGRPVNLNWVLGGVRRDASGAVVSAECFQSVLYMKFDAVGADGGEVAGQRQGACMGFYELWQRIMREPRSRALQPVHLLV